MRVLRRRDLAGLLLNAMIGAGMLAAPAKVFGLAGDWSFLVLVAAAIILIPLILCFADLGSRFTGTGGPYLYAYAALPPVMAFSVGWLLWLSQALAVATLSNLLVTYLGGFFPVLEHGLPRVGVIVALGVTLTTIALTGMRQSAGASNLLILIKVGFVVGFVVACAAFVQPARLAIAASAAPPPATFAQAILLYLFAYSGFERGAVLAGEAKDPKRDVPLALIMSVAGVTLVYAAVLLVCVGVLEAPAANDRPLAETGRLIYGPIGAVAVSAGALAVILGTILVVIVSMPRMMLALAEKDQLPAGLAQIHPKWRTPWIAILISSALAFGLALVNDLLGALTFSTATRLMAYILCCVALWRMTRRADAPRPQFKLPAAGPVALVTAALFVGVLVLGATKELPALLVVLMIGLVVLALHRRRAQGRAP